MTKSHRDPDDVLLAAAAKAAFAMLEQVDGELRRLPSPQREFVVVYHAQGVIDNGGLRYLFENDTPGAEPYATFVGAYRAIGAGPEADAIAAAAAMFDFPDAQREGVRRNERINAGVGDRLDLLDAKMTSDVWALLAAYVRVHEAAFLQRG